MQNPRGPIIDMTPEGTFIPAPRLTLGGVVLRVLAVAAVLWVAWLAFWTALFLLPVVLLLAAAGYVAFRIKTSRWW